MASLQASHQLQRDRINAVRLVDRLEATSKRLDLKGKGPAADGATEDLDYWQLKAFETTVLRAQRTVASLPRGAIAPAVLADMRGRLVAVEQRTTAALASTRPPKTLNSSATFDIDFSLPPPPAPPTIAPTRPPVGIPAETAPSPTSDNSDGAFLDGDDLDSSIAGGDPFGGAARPRDELLAGSKPPPPTQAPDVESSTQGIDSLLSQHRSTQDALTSELADMASQLRQNAHHFNTLLEKDKAVMEDAKDKLDGNLTRMQKEGGRLGKYAKRARGTTCYTILAITMVAVAWTVMFVVIRIT